MKKKKKTTCTRLLAASMALAISATGPAIPALAAEYDAPELAAPIAPEDYDPADAGLAADEAAYADAEKAADFEVVVIDGKAYYPVTTDGAEISNLSTTDIIDIRAKNVTVKNCTCGGIIVGADGAMLLANTVNAVTGDGITVYNGVNGGRIEGNAINATAGKAITITGAAGITVSNNTINGTGGDAAISLTRGTSGCNVSGNKIGASAQMGIYLYADTGSNVGANQILGSGQSAAANLAHGIKLEDCRNTTVSANIITDVKGSAGIASAVILTGCTGLQIANNQITGAAGEGILVANGSKEIKVSDNQITKTGPSGITVRAGAQAALTGNHISETAIGILADGTKVTAGSSVLEGAAVSVENNTISDTTDACIDLVTATASSVKGNTAGDCGGPALRVYMTDAGSVTGNTFYQTKRNSTTATGIGMLFTGASKAAVEENFVCNFGCHGISNSDSTVNAKNNQVMVDDATLFQGTAAEAYHVEGSHSGTMESFAVRTLTVGEQTASGASQYGNCKAGAVVKKNVYTTTTGSDGRFTVSYQHADPEEVIVFVKDINGNAVIFNADPGFDLNHPENYITVEQRKKVEAFVRRMYTIILNREAEMEGLNYWMNGLLEGKLVAADCAKTFVLGEEMTRYNVNNAVFLERLYKTFFGEERTPASDPEGYAFWTTILDQGYSRKYVLAGFANSPEFTALCASYGIPRGEVKLENADKVPSDANLYVDRAQVEAYVERLYNEVLHRTAETDGKKYWTDRICKREISAAKVAIDGFFFSDEYKKKNTSDREFVETLYWALLGRDPAADSEGVAYWMSELSSKHMTRMQVIEKGFGNSLEFRGILQSYGLIRL
ncbi:MAG: DUF4214 domain-containing protein [Lachnospiraceae bacterium]|nr:DUF4214 domain-containing protein [Lachnospiraceae bacterium]